MIRKKYLILLILFFMIGLTGCKKSDEVTIESKVDLSVSVSDQVLTDAQKDFIDTHSLIKKIHVTDGAIYFQYLDDSYKSNIAKVTDVIEWQNGPYGSNHDYDYFTFEEDYISINFREATSPVTKTYLRLGYDGVETFRADNYLEYIRISTDESTLLYLKLDPNDENIYQLFKQTDDTTQVIYSFDKSKFNPQYAGIIGRPDDVFYLRLKDTVSTEKYVIIKDYEVVKEFVTTSEDRLVQITNKGYLFCKTDNTIEITNFDGVIQNVVQNGEYDMSSYYYYDYLSEEDNVLVLRSRDYENQPYEYIKVQLGGTVDYEYEYINPVISKELAVFSDGNVMNQEIDNTINRREIVMKNSTDETLWSIPIGSAFYKYDDIKFYDEWFAIQLEDKLETYNYDGELIARKEMTVLSIFKHPDDKLICTTDDGKIIVYDKNFTEILVKDDVVYRDEIYVTAEGNIVVAAENDNRENGLYDLPFKDYSLISLTGDTIETYGSIYSIGTSFVVEGNTYAYGFVTSSANYTLAILFQINADGSLTLHQPTYFSIDADTSRVISFVEGDKIVTYKVNFYN